MLESLHAEDLFFHCIAFTPGEWQLCVPLGSCPMSGSMVRPTPVRHPGRPVPSNRNGGGPGALGNSKTISSLNQPGGQTHDKVKLQTIQTCCTNQTPEIQLPMRQIVPLQRWKRAKMVKHDT